MVVSDKRARRLRERVREGSEAERLLNDPVLSQAFKEVEEQYIKLWAATPSDQSRRREELYYALNGLRDAKSKLASAVRGSQIAEMELAQLEESTLEEALYG